MQTNITSDEHTKILIDSQILVRLNENVFIERYFRQIRDVRMGETQYSILVSLGSRSFVTTLDTMTGTRRQDA